MLLGHPSFRDDPGQRTWEADRERGSVEKLLKDGDSWGDA